jgi:hypothetical protein
MSVKKYYPPARALHLYVGLFISPFVFIFGISVLVFNHPAFINRVNTVKVLPERRTKFDKTPHDTSDIATASAILKKLNISGEIDFISKTDSTISFPVMKPGLRINLKVNTNTDSVLIIRKQEGPLRATTYLHSMPGPHNVKVRGNSAFMKAWRILSDAVVYLLLFLTVSGVFLWYFLKVERVPGIYALTLGVLFFAGLLLMIFNYA